MWPSFVPRQPSAFPRWELPKSRRGPSRRVRESRLLREPLRHGREDVVRGALAEEQVDVAVVGGGAVLLGDEQPLLARRAERLVTAANQRRGTPPAALARPDPPTAAGRPPPSVLAARP